MLRERFGIYTDATCPANTILSIARDLTIDVCRETSVAGRTLPAICPAGSGPYSILTESFQQYVICVPAGTAVYAPRTVTSPTEWPCAPGDYFGTSASSPTEQDFKCIPSSSASTSASSSPASSSSGETIESLSTQYTTLKAEYDALAAQALATPSTLATSLPRLQSINQQMASLVDQMLKDLQYAKAGPNSDAYRDQLVETLGRIQVDYNGLKTETDALQTLKRIRSFQDTSWQSSLNLYIGLLLLFACVLVLVMVFRHQKRESASAPTTSPSAMPPFT